jgi:PAS domain S-box-containing protein
MHGRGEVHEVNENEEWFQEIVDFAPVGIAVIDAVGSARYVNRRLAEITHRSPEGLLGLDLRSFLVPDDRMPTFNPDETVREGHQYRSHVDVAAGSPCIVEVVLRWMTDDDNHHTGAVAVIDDITAQVMAELRERAGGRHRATEGCRPVTARLASLAHMAAGIAHEFDNTLASMLSARGDSEGGRAVPHRRTGPTSHPPAVRGGDAPARTGFDVNDLIRATVPPMVDRENAVTLSLRLAEPPIPVHMDPVQLAEVLRFLTINAIEAMPRGCTITILASRATNRPAALPGGEFAHISVVDNGRGMAAEALEHAIEPFFTTKVGAPWVGLGLATTYGIVNRAGGRMSISSAPGAGSTVHVYVPSRVAGQQGAPPGDGRVGDSRGTLLVVDDNQDLRTLATRLLTDAGFEVMTANGGVEAMAILHDRAFDCLVTDIAMPGMGGIDLAERVHAANPDMPVVFVSGFVNIAWGPGGPLPDDAHSIAKPYTPEALTAAVRRALRSRSTKVT